MVREKRAVPLVNGGGLGANAFRKIINGADDQRHNAQREQRELPIDPHHDGESAKQGDARSENVGEPLVVHRLDRLRIVGDAETGIRRAARVVIAERERLEVGVDFGAQVEERLESDFHEKEIREQTDGAADELQRDERGAEQRQGGGPIESVDQCSQAARRDFRRNQIIDDDLERPRFEQVQSDAAESEREPEQPSARGRVGSSGARDDRRT